MEFVMVSDGRAVRRPPDALVDQSQDEGKLSNGCGQKRLFVLMTECLWVQVGRINTDKNDESSSLSAQTDILSSTVTSSLCWWLNFTNGPLTLKISVCRSVLVWASCTSFSVKLSSSFSSSFSLSQRVLKCVGLLRFCAGRKLSHSRTEADHKVSQFSPNELLQVHADPTHKRLQELFYCELYQIIPLVQKKQQQRRLELNVGFFWGTIRETKCWQISEEHTSN